MERLKSSATLLATLLDEARERECMENSKVLVCWSAQVKEMMEPSGSGRVGGGSEATRLRTMTTREETGWSRTGKERRGEERRGEDKTGQERRGKERRGQDGTGHQRKREERARWDRGGGAGQGRKESARE
eukprot:457292-Hanusia_phi.AAC.2